MLFIDVKWHGINLDCLGLKVQKNVVMKPSALALMGGKILLCWPRGFGGHKRFGRTAGNSSLKFS